MPARELNAAAVGIPDFEFTVAEDPAVFALSSHARAHDALVLGLERPGPQYNIYVLGPDQAGRMTATRAYVESWARAHAPASDWLYLLDFDAPQPWLSTMTWLAQPAGEPTLTSFCAVPFHKALSSEY